MDIFDEFATDEQLEIEGVWVDYDEKTKFKIAREYNEHFTRLFSETQAKHKRALAGRSKEAKDLANRLMVEIMAKTILLGWEGPVMYQKQPLTYSYENAVKVLTLKGFRAWVVQQASNEALYRDTAEKDDEKN